MQNLPTSIAVFPPAMSFPISSDVDGVEFAISGLDETFSASSAIKCGMIRNANDSQIADLTRKRIIMLAIGSSDSWAEINIAQLYKYSVTNRFGIFLIE